MAMGVPVLTRNIGHVPEIYNGENMIVRNGDVEDKEDLKHELKQLMENKDQREKIRQKAWDSVKNRNADRMIWDIEKIYWNIAKSDKQLVSIVIPTKDNPEVLAECLVKAAMQDYKKKEIIVADSGDNMIDYVIREIQKKLPEVTIKHVQFKHKQNYTLAEARNRAVIEARGEWIVFCDDRIGMESNAVSQFMKMAKERTWLWGVKDDNQKPFVENFSCVQRKYLVGGGMFNERMQWYGGMSEDVRNRYAGMSFDFIYGAKAFQIKGAGKKSGRRKDIVRAKNLIHKLYD
jgi:glycosyltransferase involved in cell wall biosynthesis